MKRILAFLLILILVIPANVCFVFANNLEGVILSKDFNDYKTSGTLPSDFSVIKVDENTTYDANPYVFGYGNDTALRLTSKGTTETYVGCDMSSLSITEGVVKVSFQLCLEDLGRKEGSPQVIHVYLGKGETTPYVKGMRISNGKVQYASSNSNRWTHADTTFSVEPLKWYTFDVISDFDNNKTYYYMDGKPFIDDKTGEIVEVPCYDLSATKSVNKLQFLVRSHHPDGEGTGGDIFVDNISVSTKINSGVSIGKSNDISENPSKFDVKFNTTINTLNFSKDDVKVTLHTKDDAMLIDGDDVDFEILNLSPIGCEIILGEPLDLKEYEKVKVDFGKNKDFLGNDLSYDYVVKVPEKKESLVLYDSETAGDYGVEVSGDANISSTDYNYTQKSVNKSAKIYTAARDITGSAKIDIKSTDSTKNLFDEGSVYNLSFKMKILQNQTSSQLQYNIRGYFGEGTYIKDGIETTYDEGAARMLVFLTHVDENPRIYNQTNPSATVSTTKVGKLYSFNSDASITTTDTDALFEKQKWLDVDLTYYPDTKLYDVTFTTEDGTVVTKELQNAYYMDISHSSYYKSAPKAEVDGGLKSIQFMIPKSGTILLDDLLLTKSDIPQSDAAIKNVVLKDEKGNIISSSNGYFAPGASKIEIHFDGAVDENKIYDLTFTGLNTPIYNTEYDKIKKIFTISMQEGTCLGGSGNFSINLPSSMSFEGGLTQIDFSTSDGDVNLTNPVISLKDTTASASLYAKNTTVDVNTPSTFIIATYKNGEVLNVLKCDLAVNKCSYKDVTTGEVSISDADEVKAFVLNNNGLNHLAKLQSVKISDALDKDKTYQYEVSVDLESEYVTSVLMNPTSSDNKTTYTLDNLADLGSFSYIDVVEATDNKAEVKFNINGDSGKYVLYVADENGQIILTKEIYHSNEEDCEDVQILLNKAVSDYEDSSEVLNVLNEYYIELGLMSIDLYKDADKHAIADKLYTSIKNESLDISNSKDALKRVGDILLIDALNNKKITDVDNYTQVTKVFDNKNINEWYKKGIANSEKITTRLLDKDLTMNNFADKTMEAIALEVIDEGNGYENVVDLLKLLSKKIGIDFDKASASVCRLIDSNTYSDYGALKTHFVKLTSSNKSSSSGGGGGSKVSVGTVITPFVPMPSVPGALKQHTFKDIANYEWATESIQKLYDKNIISGRSEDLFAPNEVVLREEFVKMIVQAFGITQTKDASFDDVKDNDWFKPYILKAYGAGIVNGQGSIFGIGKSITRQDMAKIIYQAAMYKGIKFTKADITGLDDYNNISDYAVEAVSNLYNAGIIKGKSQNTFAPNDFATRAEAAVIVSRALALLN